MTVSVGDDRISDDSAGCVSEETAPSPITPQNP
jgi:hypothetical protein